MDTLKDIAAGMDFAMGRILRTKPSQGEHNVHNVKQILSRLLDIRNRKERLRAEEKELSGQQRALEYDLLEIHETTDQTKFEVDGVPLAASVNPNAMRARYDPEAWPETQKWLIEHDYGHVIQRRLNDRAVVELLDQGVELPDGLSVEAYPKLSIRRL